MSLLPPTLPIDQDAKLSATAPAPASLVRHHTSNTAERNVGPAQEVSRGRILVSG